MILVLDDGTEIHLDDYGPDAFGNPTWIGDGYVVTKQAD